MIEGATDKAAVLSQIFQDIATDGIREGRQGIVGLVHAAVSYIPPFRRYTGFINDEEKVKEQEQGDWL
ncbi:hypothetical protein Vi05172_g10037 [Venturia inaequalis]|nr:hypothetical protein Vi05172_g10037 [Venturia inaequalis]